MTRRNMNTLKMKGRNINFKINSLQPHTSLTKRNIYYAGMYVGYCIVLYVLATMTDFGDELICCFFKEYV
jgi:hypothetical protein